MVVWIVVEITLPIIGAAVAGVAMRILLTRQERRRRNVAKPNYYHIAAMEHELGLAPSTDIKLHQTSDSNTPVLLPSNVKITYLPRPTSVDGDSNWSPMSDDEDASPPQHAHMLFADYRMSAAEFGGALQQAFGKRRLPVEVGDLRRTLDPNRIFEPGQQASAVQPPTPPSPRFWDNPIKK